MTSTWEDVPITYTLPDGTVERNLGMVNATPAQYLAVFVQPCIPVVRFEGPDAPRFNLSFDSWTAGKLVAEVANHAFLRVLDDGDVVRLVVR